MWRCALRGRNRGKAAAYRHLLILMELSETICQQQGLVLNILLEGRWKCLLFFFFICLKRWLKFKQRKQYCSFFNICIEFGLGCHYTFWIKEATILWTKLNAWKHNSPLLIEYFNRSAMWSSVMSVAPPAHYDRVVVAVYFSSRFMIFTCHSKANSHS